MKKIIAALAVTLIGISGAAKAEYPERPVLLMIPYGAGGATDFQARIATIPAGNDDMLGMPVAIINKPGAGGRVGWNWFANEAEKDGYTMGGYNIPHFIAQSIKGGVDYSTDSFEPIANWGSDPAVFVVDKDIIDNHHKDSLKITFSTKISESKPAENVLGFIPGKSDEIIVLSAHYDHIGYDNGEICNGADDDGSGTSALLEIAKAFQKANDDGITPERGLLFLAVSGEEKGLFGSKYYTDNPVIPLSKTILDLNIDMVGRKDTIHTNSNYIYLIGSNRISNELHKISEQVNKKHINFELDYTYNDKNDPNRFYERSDHYNFAKNNIPVIFYFGGLHADYHQPTDDFEKIDFLKLERVSRFVFLTAWELAYRKKTLSK